MSVKRGLDAKLYIGSPGTLVAYLTGIEFSWESEYTEFCAMGTAYVTDLLLGVKRYRGAYKKAYIDNTYAGLFVAGTLVLGTIVPTSGGSMGGTIAIVGGSFENMVTEESSAVIENGSFVMYGVTFS